MTRDEAKKLLPVIQAFADGKIVQLRAFGAQAWLNSSDPAFNPVHEWRIKPESLECWVTVDRDGDRAAYKTESDAKTSTSYGGYGPYTIHHMREVI